MVTKHGAKNDRVPNCLTAISEGVKVFTGECILL